MKVLWKNRLAELTDGHMERSMRSVEGPPCSGLIEAQGTTKLSFCSNDYLGLAGDLQIRGAMAHATEHWGCGTASSRLVSGNTVAHDRLEDALARYLGSERAILFPSGYQANVGSIPALTAKGDIIFSDRLSHASIVDGCRLSHGETRIYDHADPAHLEQLLKSENTDGIKLVVTDAVFSMDGDLAPLGEIVEIAKANNALVYLDEAHSLGVMGPGGRGLAAKLGLEDSIAVRIGTMGKAMAVCGAFTACDKYADGLIRSRARSLLYTTGAPAPLVEASLKSLELMTQADDRRSALKDNTNWFKMLAKRASLPLIESDTAIQPIMIGTAAHTMEISSQLWKKGLFVQGIRPPTVPEGTSRLRVTISATHTREQIETLVVALEDALKP